MTTRSALSPQHGDAVLTTVRLNDSHHSYKAMPYENSICYNAQSGFSMDISDREPDLFNKSRSRSQERDSVRILFSCLLYCGVEAGSRVLE